MRQSYRGRGLRDPARTARFRIDIDFSCPVIEWEISMPLFMIERNFADAFNASTADYAAVVQINDQAGVKWLYSFLSADKRKTYCLYEAKSGDAIREAAKRAGLPADIIIELAGELRPELLIAS